MSTEARSAAVSHRLRFGRELGGWYLHVGRFGVRTYHALHPHRAGVHIFWREHRG